MAFPRLNREHARALLQNALAAWSEDYEDRAEEALDLLLDLMDADQGIPSAKAVDRVLDAVAMDVPLREGLRSLLLESVAAGYGILPSMVADPEKVTAALLSDSWTGDGMRLSTRIHSVTAEYRAEVADTLRRAWKVQKGVLDAARDLYDGYGRHRVIRRADELPEYLEKLRRQREALGRLAPGTPIPRAWKSAEARILKLAQDGAPNRALKAAYNQLLEAVKAGTEAAVSRAVRVCLEERSRYMAERIARTEAARAYSEGLFARVQDDDDVVAVRWVLGSRHPFPDICDFHANADLYGLGPGVYPKGRCPRIPAHPHCLCHYAEVYELDYDDEVPTPRFNPEGGDRFLESVPSEDRRQMLSTAGERAWRAGSPWSEVLRGWEGHGPPPSRVVHVLAAK